MYVHDTLLLACGTPASRSALRAIFEEKFNLLEADNTHQTLMLLEQNHPCIAAVLIDQTVPEKTNPDILSKIEAFSLREEIPTIVFIDSAASFLATLAYEHGAVDVVSIPYEPSQLFFRIQNIINLYRHKWYLEEQVEEQTHLLRRFNDSIVDALASIIEHRSVESGRHILRIRRFTQILLEEVAINCPEYELSKETIRIISSASALHDVGKISIPDSILNKPGRLTADEWSIMKNHTLTGCQILETFHDIVNQDYLRYAHNICHYHHERWNGGGYPEGISGNDIPICAQVVGLADAYDALTTKRAYKDAYPFDQAVNMILNGECGTFSPKLLECFKALVGRFEETARAYADGLSPQTEDFDVTLPVPSPNADQNSLQRLQYKYQTLLHHINATAIEADLERNFFHMIYNPYPDLAALGTGHTLSDLIHILYQVISPQDHDKLNAMMRDEIPRLMRFDVHRLTYHLQTQNRSSRYSSIYQMTILNSSSDNAAKRILILFQKENPISAPYTASREPEGKLKDDIINNLLKGLFCFRKDQWLTFQDVGSQFGVLLGYSDAEIRTLFHGHFLETILPEDRSIILSKMEKQLKTSLNVEFFCRMRHKNGDILWICCKGYLDTADDGQELIYCTLSDITRASEKQNRHMLTLEQYQSILNLKNNVLFDWNLNNDHITISKQWAGIFGYQPITDHLISQLYISSHFHPEDIPVLLQHIQALQNGSSYQAMETRIAKADGRYLWCRIRATAARDDAGDIHRIVGTIINIDEEKRTAKTLQEQAQKDALTKLLNQNTARRQAEEYLSSSHDEECAFLVIDLDRFKYINDTYGHLFGDTVLSQTAAEIKKLFRTQDIIARIGGDEFLVIMKGMSNRELISNRCDRLLSALHALFPEQLQDNPLSASIGISLGPQHGSTYQELFQCADQALYLAKDTGKNMCRFHDDPEISSFRKHQ